MMLAAGAETFVDRDEVREFIVLPNPFLGPRSSGRRSIDSTNEDSTYKNRRSLAWCRGCFAVMPSNHGRRFGGGRSASVVAGDRAMPSGHWLTAGRQSTTRFPVGLNFSDVRRSS